MNLIRFITIILVTSLLMQSALAQNVSEDFAKRLTNILENDTLPEEEKLAALGKLVERERNRPDQQAYAILERIPILVESDREQQALEELTQAVSEREPGEFPLLVLTLGRIQLITGQTEAALATIESWRNSVKEPTPQGLFFLGYTYLRVEDFDKAVEALEEAISRLPKPRISWQELLAYAYAGAGRTDDAIDLMLGILNKSPDSFRRWKQLSGFYQVKEDLPRASATLAVADEVEALSFADARYLARMFAYIGMPYEGAALLSQKLSAREKEDHYKDLLLLGRLWLQAREFDRALTVLHAATKVAEDGEAWLQMGQVHLHWERYNEALAALQQATLTYNESVPAEVQYYTALAAINMDKNELARQTLEPILLDRIYGRRANNLLRFIQEAN